jgi:hypothetical protein
MLLAVAVAGMVKRMLRAVLVAVDLAVDLAVVMADRHFLQRVQAVAVVVVARAYLVATALQVLLLFDTQYKEKANENSKR